MAARVQIAQHRWLQRRGRIDPFQQPGELLVQGAPLREWRNQRGRQGLQGGDHAAPVEQFVLPLVAVAQ